MSTVDWDLMGDSELDDHLAMSTALAEDDEETFGPLRDDAAQVKQRREAVRREAARQRAEREANSPEGKLRSLKAQLAAAEKELAVARTTNDMAPAHSDAAEVANANANRAAQQVASLKAKVETAQRRLPFVGVKTDELELAAESTQESLAGLQAELNEIERENRATGIEDPRTVLKAKRLRSEINKASQAVTPLMNELATRQEEARTSSFADALAKKKAKAMRTAALSRWTETVSKMTETLGDPNRSGLIDLGALQDAQNNVKMLQNAISKDLPVGRDELAQARSVLMEGVVLNSDGSAEITSWV
jgi:chromosome segregation ATPase